MLFISHDLGIIKYISDRIMIMYLGRVMEFYTPKASTQIRSTRTRRLCSPRSRRKARLRKERLPLTGDILSPIGDQVGLPARRPLPALHGALQKEIPKLVDTGDGHMVACLYE